MERSIFISKKGKINLITLTLILFSNIISFGTDAK